MPKKLSKQAQTPTSPTFPSTATIPPSLTTTSSSSSPLPLPKLAVFDLDYTLWPFWVDTHVTPPLKPAGPGNHSAFDKFGDELSFYDDVPSILVQLPRMGVRMAVASRTSAGSLARDLLKILHLPPLPHPPSTTSNGVAANGETEAGNGVASVSTAVEGKSQRSLDAFDGVLEMYPNTKVRHFEAIHKKTGIPYEEMLFFDDEPRNRDTETLGVTMWLVRDGLTWEEVERGVAEWRKRRGHVNGGK